MSNENRLAPKDKKLVVIRSKATGKNPRIVKPLSQVDLAEAHIFRKGVDDALRECEEKEEAILTALLMGAEVEAGAFSVEIERKRIGSRFYFRLSIR